jgi:hypothetical protein
MQTAKGFKVTSGQAVFYYVAFTRADVLKKVNERLVHLEEVPVADALAHDHDDLTGF